MRTGQQLEAFSTMFGLVVSVGVHLAAFAYITNATRHFDFDFELTLPAEVEFGLTDEMAMAAAPRAAAPVDPGAGPPAEHPEEPAPLPDAGAAIADTDAATDAGTDAGTDTDADAGAGTDLDRDLPVARSVLRGPSRIPPGAHLALRVDMKRVRESPLGPDVTRFLAGVPDWQLLLEGSGIDPVADLDRLLVATPNLERSKLVLAGRHGHDPSFARASVTRLARSRGKSARWQRRFGVPTAPWYNLDRTPRTIALLSPHHFSITRLQDLQRVLAMTTARQLRDAKKEGLLAARGPDALLSMGPGEAISLEVEGVHRFVVGNIRYVPIRLRLAVRETGPDEATVSALATFSSASDARDASVYWKRVVMFYSEQLIMTLAGFGQTLRRMEFDAEDDRVRVSFKLNADQIRFLLSYAEGRLRGATGPRRPAQPAPAPIPPTKKGP